MGTVVEAERYYQDALSNLNTITTSPRQKFKAGDKVFVSITDDNSPFPGCMKHFTNNNIEAVVQYTYAQIYGGSDFRSYSLEFPDGHSSSWYYEKQLTLIEDN